MSLFMIFSVDVCCVTTALVSNKFMLRFCTHVFKFFPTSVMRLAV